jgi:hypothetical protein
VYGGRCHAPSSHSRNFGRRASLKKSTVVAGALIVSAVPCTVRSGGPLWGDADVLDVVEQPLVFGEQRSRLLGVVADVARRHRSALSLRGSRMGSSFA